MPARDDFASRRVENFLPLSSQAKSKADYPDKNINQGGKDARADPSPPSAHDAKDTA
jgi:hypothetical protein